MSRSGAAELGGRAEGVEPAGVGAGGRNKAEQPGVSRTVWAPSWRSGAVVRGARGAAGRAGAGAWRGARGAAGMRGVRTLREPGSRTAEGRWKASRRRERSGRSGGLGAAWPEWRRCRTRGAQSDTRTRARGVRLWRTGEEHRRGAIHGDALQV
jgi:hypothetical protein